MSQKTKVLKYYGCYENDLLFFGYIAMFYYGYGNKTIEKNASFFLRAKTQELHDEFINSVPIGSNVEVTYNFNGADFSILSSYKVLNESELVAT